MPAQVVHELAFDSPGLIDVGEIFAFVFTKALSFVPVSYELAAATAAVAAPSLSATSEIDSVDRDPQSAAVSAITMKGRGKANKAGVPRSSTAWRRTWRRPSPT
jgi:hypothetical protein